MKAFVTGGAGFIGSNLVDALIEKDYEITVYDNLSSGRKKFISQYFGKNGFKFIQGEISDVEKLKDVMRGSEYVFHFASNPDIARGMVETDLDLREGTILTYNVLEAMRVNNVRKILYPSGSGVYGDVGAVATAEDYGPLLPISMYGASKLACEAMISAFCHMFDMQVWIFRFANVVGGRQTHGVCLDFIRKLKKNPQQLEILGDGTQSKSYIHIKDCLEAMLFTMQEANEKVNIYNVATDDYLDVTSIANIVVEEMGLKSVQYKYTGGDRGWKGDVPLVRFNLNKIHKLGWKARYTSSEAVRLSVKEILGLG